MNDIPTWHARAMCHPDHQSGMVSEDMLRARMTEEIVDLRAEVDRQRAEIERLREALKFYAHEYCELGEAFEGCGKLPVEQCGGCLARAALDGRT